MADVLSVSQIVALGAHAMHGGEEEEECNRAGGSDSYLKLRVASIFVILVGSSLGALFPILAQRSRWLRVPGRVIDFAKYFGSGVIIATAFIHLLLPGMEALGSSCLSAAWREYPYALALCMFSIFGIFVMEIIAIRWGNSKLAALETQQDSAKSSIRNSAVSMVKPDEKTYEGSTAILVRELQYAYPPSEDAESSPPSFNDSPLAQLVGTAILEFGVVLHSVLIGLTLAVDEGFKVLFPVIVFHQTFEGLALGARLAQMQLPTRYSYVPVVAALIFGVTSPLGIAAGLAVRTMYAPGSPTALITSGVMDSLSAGILIYTGLVELLAHEFLFNKEMMNGSSGKLAFALGSVMLGCALMSLLGRWA
ncbi:hypothetical protein HGRIS_014438 [Hohenbuehelia grisea]|uniref:Uncharacterized protein n=1 Tax=Hohenbuehelia grisea TaxID=104357 RepID=A0ABR3JUB3_9AGAR